MSLVGKLLILSGTLWLSAMALIVYVWIIHARQRTLLRYIAQRLAKIEGLLAPDKEVAPAAAKEKRASKKEKGTEKAHPETIITIDKNEPLSKYETVNLPDEIDINFVDR